MWLLLISRSALGQDLDPRAYVSVPTGLTVTTAGVNVSSGGVITDPTSPVKNVHADVLTASAGVAESFSVFGRTAQGLAVIPYSWAHVTGDVAEQAQQVDRSGLSDMRLRLSLLIAGAPAMTPQQFAKAPRRPIVGTSLTLAAPSGQYDSGRLVNLGTNRWGFKPEVALSYPFGQRCLFDAYAGVWLFTTNDAFYPGTAVKTQATTGTLQAHISYSLSLKAWAAFDATWYSGGRVSVNDVITADRESNSRIGAVLVLPVGTRHAIKLAWSTGAFVRSGTDFTTFSVGWQAGWLNHRRQVSSGP